MGHEIFNNEQVSVTIDPTPLPSQPQFKRQAQEVSADPPARAENPLAPHTRGVFQSRDNTSIYYEVYGQGKPLLMCYGLVCRREHWRHQLSHFAKDYQVILFDYRGHQFSGRPSNDKHLTLEWCANDIQDLLKYLKVDEVVGLGHSMGVGILTRAALLEKSRFKGTVFICGTVTNPFEQMFYSNSMNQVHQLASTLFDLMPETMSLLWQRLTQNNRLNFTLASYLGFNADKAQVRDVNSYIDGVNQIPFAVFHALIDDYTRFEGKKYLSQMECPTLVVTGDKDVITPRPVQEEMLALLVKGEMHVVSGGSHNSHTDFPLEVNRAIETFLGKIGYR
jgi:pimeloyl-ACP methyl ester carboxylesterase